MGMKLAKKMEMSGKEERTRLREERQRQIAEFALEMSTTTASFKPTNYKQNVMANRQTFEKGLEESGAVVVNEGEEEDDEDTADNAISNGRDGASDGDASNALPSSIEEDDDMNADGNNSSNSNNDNMSNSVDYFAEENKIPISHQIELAGHTKAVVTISIEPAGNRLATGSLDYNVKMYDFGGMDSRCRPFRSLEAVDSHPVSCVAHAYNGEKFVVCTGSSQIIVYDREGTEIIKTCKGDMYIRDLNMTKGHTMEVTGCQWHPSDKNIFATSSLDGSLRIWNLLGEAHFGNLMSKSVLKLRSSAGGSGVAQGGRLGATAVCYSPDAAYLIGGAADGSVHVWKNKKILGSKADFIVPCAHGGPVSAVLVSRESSLLFSRCNELGPLSTSPKSGVGIKCWNLKALQPNASTAGNQRNNGSLFQCTDLPNEYPTANMDLSPDGSFLVAGSSSSSSNSSTQAARKVAGSSSAANSNSSNDSSKDGHSGSSSTKAMLHFYDIKSAVQAFLRPGESNGVVDSPALPTCLRITAAPMGSVICVKWHPKTNQIFCGLSSHKTVVFFNPTMSTKGALLASSRPVRREADTADASSAMAVGEIINPNALPMYRNDPKLKRLEAFEARKRLVPHQPVDSGPKQKINTSFFYTHYVAKCKEAGLPEIVHEDPRQKLLALDEVTKNDPRFLGRAYATSQPQGTILHEKTFEEEQEEFKKKQRKL